VIRGLALLVTVALAVEAAPRPVRVVVVLERSVAVGPVIAQVREAAAAFVTAFRDGRDRLGLVVFGASGIVAFPARNPAHPESGSGPASNFLTTNPSILDLVGSIQAGSNAGTSEALWLAYRELAKQPVAGTTNAIVLFTHGRPNGITVDLNGSEPAQNLLRPSSPCKYRSAETENLRIRGVLAQQCGFQVACRSLRAVVGLRALMNETADDAHPDAASWLRDGHPEPVLATKAAEGCAFQRDPYRIAEDVRAIPELDAYGNSTGGEDYRESLLFRKEHIPLNRSAVGSPYQIGLASWNAAADAARRIRWDERLNVAVHTIALASADDPPDEVLLRGIANCPDAGMYAYSPEHSTGTCTIVESPSMLKQAFLHVAAEIRGSAR
jgi:hypothetical protein